MGKEQIQTEATEKAPPSTVVEKPAPAIQKAVGPQRAMMPERTAQETTATADSTQRIRRLASLQRQATEAAAGQQAKTPVQRKTEVGGPDDAFEREAHSMAEHVTNGAKTPPPQISRLATGAAPQPGEKKPAVQTAVAEEKREPAVVPKLATDQTQPKTDDKQVQRLASDAPTEDKIHRSPNRSVQRAEAAPAQTAQNEPKPMTEQHAVQRAPRSTTGGAESAGLADTAENAIASKGPGRPMNAGTRHTLEDRMGTDLSHVRVHDDEQAQQASKALNARAFTHQNDVWLGRGESDTDTRLMAHEATHVVQQSGSAQRWVQREVTADGGGGAKGKKDAKSTLEPATLAGNTVSIPRLRIPKYVRKANSVVFPLILPHPKPERPNDQRQVWGKDIAEDSGFKTNVKNWLDKNKIPKVKSDKTGKDNYFLRPEADSKKYLIGDLETLPPKLSTPTWDKSGKYHSFDVDHIQEIQLGGKNKPENMELLDSKANRSSGASINADIQRKAGAAAKQLGDEGKIAKKITDLEALRKNNYLIRFENKDDSYEVEGEPDKYFWPREKTKAGDHLDALRTLTPDEINEVRGDPTRLVLLNRRGLKLGEIKDWGAAKTHKPSKNFLPSLELESATYEQGKGGSITGTLFPKHPPLVPLKDTWPIAEEPGIEFGGSIGLSLNGLRLTGLSPIEVFEADLDPRGVYIRGVIKPSVSLFEGVEIDFLVEGTDITLSKTFNTGEFAFPKPISVTDSSLTVSVGTRGLSASGEVQFEIERVGTGQLKGLGAIGESDAGFSIEGSFTFDKKLFDDAKVEAWYKKNAFGARGHIGIKEGKIKGIKSASFDASYDAGKLQASGNARLSIPGVKEGALSLSYSEAEGFAIGGSFQLADNIPGIKGGSIEAQVKQKPDGGGYDVKAAGRAEPKIPGVNASVAVTYDNGALTIEGTAAYEKGMLKGSVLIGATNRPIGEDGRPAGEPGRTLKAYGGGTVTIKIAPWLQGTIGLKLKPNGEIEVSGSIGLPASLDIFPEKKLDKNIFKIGLDIPLFGVAVAGQRIGIFANITGGLDLSAGIGPGQLQESGLSVTYNPAHEDQTHVVGGAKLHIPAHAGLRLFVRGGLGVGIPIVSAQAGLEIGGQLGLEGAINAGVQIDWTPAHGLVLDAHGEIYVEPKLKFDITGFVLVEADLLITTIELYNKRWQLAGFEYGSGLRFGVKFPIHYEEGKPFDLSLSDLQFEVPDIKPQDVLSDLVKKIV